MSTSEWCTVHGCCYGSSTRGSRWRTAGAAAAPPPPRQRGFHPGHGKAPPRTGTRGPQRDSSSRPRLCSGLSAEGCWRGLNACLPGPGAAAILPATSSSAHPSVVGTAVGASAGESAGQLSPPAAGSWSSNAGSADVGGSRRATAHTDSRRGSIVRAREAGIVACCGSCRPFFLLCWIEVRQMVLVGEIFFVTSKLNAGSFTLIQVCNRRCNMHLMRNVT